MKNRLIPTTKKPARGGFKWLRALDLNQGALGEKMPKGSQKVTV